MPVIKSANSPAAAVPFSMRDIENHARLIIRRAQEQAEALLIEAQKEAEALQAAARADGLAEGRREGQAKGLEDGKTAGHAQALAEHKNQLAAVVKAVTAASAEIDASRRQLESLALREVVALAVGIARRVTKRHGLLDPEVLTANLAEAMRLTVSAADLRIAVHPTQKTYLTDALPRLQLTWPPLAHVELIEDPSLAPGGCRVFTRHGQIDADLDAQLDRVIGDLLPDKSAADEPSKDEATHQG